MSGGGIQCAYHIGSWITNFCEESACLMPLCPKCLPIHTEEHKQKKTYGSFTSIDDAFVKAEQIIYQRIIMLKNKQAKLHHTDIQIDDTKLQLIQQINEAKGRFIYEVEQYFDNLKRKCETICSSYNEVGYFQNELLSQSNSSFLSIGGNQKLPRQQGPAQQIEKDILSLQEFQEGMQTRDRCLKSLICAFRAAGTQQISESNESEDPLFYQNNAVEQAVQKIVLRVDLARLTNISDILQSYARLGYGSKPDYTNKMENDLTFNEGNQNFKHDKNDNQSYDDEEDHYHVSNDPTSLNGDDKNRIDDVYLLNDPNIIKLRQRREERRIRIELREIGKKQLSPRLLDLETKKKIHPLSNTLQMQQLNRTKSPDERKSNIRQNSSNYQASLSNPSQLNYTNNRIPSNFQLNPQEKKSTVNLSSQDESSQERMQGSPKLNSQSQNFITYERPMKDQLQKYAKPDELKFLEMMQLKSQKMQEDFDFQQRKIYQNAIDYQIPSTSSNIRFNSPSHLPLNQIHYEGPSSQIQPRNKNDSTFSQESSSQRQNDFKTFSSLQEPYQLIYNPNSQISEQSSIQRKN